MIQILLINNPFAPGVCPGAIGRPCIDFGSIIGNAIGATASHITDAVNMRNVSKTNEANRDINREQLEAQKAMNERAFEVEQKQWERNTAYDLERLYEQREYDRQKLLEQRGYDEQALKRDFDAYRSLGLNPYLMMAQSKGAGSVGSAVSSSSPISSPSTSVPSGGSVPSAIPMQPFLMDSSVAFRNMKSLVDTINEARSQSREDKRLAANIEFQKQENFLKAMDYMSQHTARVSHAGLEQSQKRLNELEHRLRSDTFDFDVKAKELMNQSIQQQMANEKQRVANDSARVAIDRYNAKSSRILSEAQAKYTFELFESQRFENDLRNTFAPEIYKGVSFSMLNDKKKQEFEELLLSNGVKREIFKSDNDWLNYCQSLWSVVGDPVKFGASMLLFKGLK